MALRSRRDYLLFKDIKKTTVLAGRHVPSTYSRLADFPGALVTMNEGLREKPVIFDASDGVTLSGIYHSIEGGPKASVVLAHGIMVHKDFDGFYPALATDLAARGYASLRFDFRGHGETGGKPERMTVAGEVRDLGAAVRFLRHRRAPQVGIVGTSFGAAVAVLYASRTRKLPFALVLLSSVLDFRRTFLEPETAWGKKWFTPQALTEAYVRGKLDLGFFALGRELLLEFEALKPADVLPNLTIPVLMVHSDGDPVAPFQAAFDAAMSAPWVKFVRIGGPGHYFEGSRDRVFLDILEWMEDSLAAKQRRRSSPGG